jgi:hypothetical protein
MTSILNEGQTEREREREQERVRAGERERERGGRSAVPRIDGCEQIFYKDLDTTGNVLTQFYIYADVLVRTACRLMKKNLFIT